MILERCAIGHQVTAAGMPVGADEHHRDSERLLAGNGLPIVPDGIVTSGTSVGDLWSVVRQLSTLHC